MDITFTHVGETFVYIDAERYVLQELKEKFSFFAKGYKFDKRYKAGWWDGRLSLINLKDKTFYKGLLPEVIDYCEQNGFEFEIDSRIFESIPNIQLTDNDVIEFYASINAPYEPLESQIEAFKYAVTSGRSIVLAPTANGKSYIIHGLNAFYALQKKRVLIIIDRSQLVLQLKDNFLDEYNASYSCETIYDNKNSKADVVVTTWQSIYKNPQKWFKQFDVIIGDEIHKFKAASLKMIIEKSDHISLRTGFTATLDNDSQCDRLTLIGMFGTPKSVATMAELIEAGVIARPTIYAVVIEHPKEHKALVHKFKDEDNAFHLECKFLESLESRNQIFIDMRRQIEGNALVAFKNIDHGNALREAFSSNFNHPIFFADGSVSKEKRVQISKEIDELFDSTAVLSTGTSSTGINVKNFNYLFLTCSLKSIITVKQLIGRLLRISERKTEATIFDFGDDLKYNGRENITWKHFQERLKIYRKEKLKVVVVRVKI